MEKLFISHSPQDNDFVRDLRASLANHGQEGWIDSRELRGGDPLWSVIQTAIEDASAYAVVVSPDALQSKWVGRELKHALAVRDQRGADKFPVIPLSLNGTKLGVLEDFFGEEPIYIPVKSEPGGIEAAINPLLVALGNRLPADVPLPLQSEAEPLEELVLELTDLKIYEQDGVRRGSARARLVYEPATQGQPDVKSEQSWRFIAPIGPIEVEELRWYLEKYAVWPSHYFRERARRVEANLAKWGQLLHDQAMVPKHTMNVMKAWARINAHADRRFSVYVDSALEDGAPEADVTSVREAATLLLALPWELLHDGNDYLFQGANPVRVRRRLPNTRVLDVPVVATPIRILLVTARPEDESCAYIDHRASALPLVEAMESLPGLVKIHILSPPTLASLRIELDRARGENKPYHVVHFDGHGVFNREVGLGGLCFEKSEDTGKLEHRRSDTVSTKELGPLLRDHRIPLVFLEACQTAQAAKASESVASELLKVGVASVVAMSHSVLVDTARRFVEAFYEALADGERVGDAMLAGQRELKDNSFRGRIFGVGELQLEDWFVPVLYQEKDDPQLFKITPTKQTQEDFRTALVTRLGHLPPVPETGFIGRSRELLALQRLLRSQRYAVVRGQGGEGKTALAAEFARWMVRSHQMVRAAFVSVETHRNLRAVVDELGKQLVHKNFTAAGELENAIREIERALREQPALLIIDNMESVLLPLFIKKEAPKALSQDAAEELKAILGLCERLLNAGDTRVVFTSREPLPAPFDAAHHRRELTELDREDAVKLVERVLNAASGDAGSSSDAAREEIEQLVDAVNCHARTLALLATSLRQHGVEATRESLVELMKEMDQKFPDSREKSVFASVELSLRRMSEVNRDRVSVLGVFHGGVQMGTLRRMTGLEEDDIASLVEELVVTGLATPHRYNYLTLNPALCPYLRDLMDAADHERLTDRWIEEMKIYTAFLVQQQHRNIEAAATLTLAELPNLCAWFELVQSKGDAEATIDVATTMYSLFQGLGKPALLTRVGAIRDAAAATLGNTWSKPQFEATLSSVEQNLATGRLQEAFDGAQKLYQRALAGGDSVYPNADFDVATAYWMLARVLQTVGAAEQALPLLDEARQRFEKIAVDRPGRGAEGMASKSLLGMGDCFLDLGRLNDASNAYEDSIARAEKLGATRDVAVGKGQLGTLRMYQRKYPEALRAFQEAQKAFTQMDEPSSVATSWHQIGMVYQEAGEPEAAEDAYQKSLAIEVRLGNVAGQGTTLNQLGGLYDSLGRLEEAAIFFQQAVDKSIESGDVFKEGLRRHNLADTLRKLQRFDQARQEIRRALACNEHFGHVSEPWKTWAVLANIEAKAGNPAASAEANRSAINCYLAYRQNGGENHDTEGRLALDITKLVLSGNTERALALLQRVAAEPDLPSSAVAYIRTLQVVVNGSRDRSLANDPELDYGMAAEILLLIDTLEKRD